MVSFTNCKFTSSGGGLYLPQNKMALILFIDDNRDTLALLEQAARLVGHESISSQTPDQGFNLALVQRPDLIFIDFYLTSSSGDQLIKKIRQAALLLNTPIIVLSAAMTSEQAAQVLAAGANRCMQKPLSLSDLTQAIESITAP